MNATRKNIQKQYNTAVNEMNAASTEEEFNSAESKVKVLRAQLILAEKQYPTRDEIERKNRNLWLANTGHDLL